MKVSNETLQRLSSLAQIKIEAKEYDELTRRLTKMTDAIDRIKEVDTSNIEPLCNPFDSIQRLRDDVVTEVDQREKYQQMTEHTEKGLYLVPQVIE